MRFPVLLLVAACVAGCMAQANDVFSKDDLSAAVKNAQALLVRPWGPAAAGTQCGGGGRVALGPCACPGLRNVGHVNLVADAGCGDRAACCPRRLRTLASLIQWA